jgi:hypothetical protein
MSSTPRDLFDYAAGRADDETKARVVQSLVDVATGNRTGDARCEEVEREIDWMELFADDEGPFDSERGGAPDTQTRRAKRFSDLRLGRRAALVLIAAGVAGTGWAGWSVLRPRPLLEDNFNDRWFDPRLWTCPRPIVREENGYLRLLNRGYIVTTKEFRGPIALAFDWRPIDLDGHPEYRDILTVALRTTGTPRSKHSYEAVDGILVKIDSQGGRVTASIASPSSIESLQLRLMDAGTLPIPADEWHRVRITDDGTNIAVFVAGPEIRGADGENPVISIAYSGHLEGRRIALYNRELVGGVLHESHIDNLVVRSLPPQ